MTHTDETATVDYAEVVRGTLKGVRQSVPADATVLVVSRGDEELLRLENRIAWHFPRGADGQYVGYHPSDSAAALAHLDEWRSRGAQYLVLPATLFWWLDYYEDFAQNLRAGHGVVFEDESCIIFRLGGALGGGTAAAVDEGRGREGRGRGARHLQRAARATRRTPGARSRGAAPSRPRTTRSASTPARSTSCATPPGRSTTKT